MVFSPYLLILKCICRLVFSNPFSPDLMEFQLFFKIVSKSDQWSCCSTVVLLSTDENMSERLDHTILQLYVDQFGGFFCGWIGNFMWIHDNEIACISIKRELYDTKKTGRRKWIDEIQCWFIFFNFTSREAFARTWYSNKRPPKYKG